jgi:uncharacterized protein involved in exopolysaccharide biosynthesis
VQENTSLKNYFNIIWENKKKILIITFIAGVISIIISLLLPKWYRGTAVILSPTTSNSVSAFGGLQSLGIGNLFNDNESIFKYMAILKSRNLREKVIRKYDLMERYDCENMQLTLKKFDNYLDIELGDEYQLNISFLDKRQDKVAGITNYIVKTTDSINTVLTVQKAKNDKSNMENRYFNIIDSLQTVSDQMADFMSDNNIIDLKEQIIAGVQAGSILQIQIIALETEIEVFEKTVNKESPKLESKKIELASLKSKYFDILNKNENYIPNFSKVPQLGAQLMKYENTIEYLTTVLKFIGPQYENFRIDELKQTPSLQVLDWAHRPDRKAKPKRAIIVILFTFVIWMLSVSYFIIRKKDIN